jgi:hypothetical protein
MNRSVVEMVGGNPKGLGDFRISANPAALSGFHPWQAEWL